jgi:hypothetical protein
MRLRIVAVSCLAVLSISRSAFAQTTIGAGVLVGQGCQQGRDHCAGAIIGPVVSVSLSDRLVVRARGFSFEVPDRTIVNHGVSINESDITRRMVLGDVVYRFRSNRRVRPVLGLSIGARTDSAAVDCVPGPCAAAFGAGAASQVTEGSPTTHASWGLIGGVGLDVTDVVGLEASVGCHDVLRDQGRTVEAALYAIVRIWKSK